jgi:uncharacterized protein YggE
MTRFFVLVSSLLALMLAPANAQEKLLSPRVSVAGEATLSVPPDLAMIRAGVVTSGSSARDVSLSNRRAMASVMNAIKAAGIEQKDIKTAGYAVMPVVDYGANKVTGFRASNIVTLTIRKLDDMGDLIDALTAAGANNFGGIDFIVSDAAKLLDKVRADALADAKRRAQIYADAAGVKLGGVLVLNENVNAPRQSMMAYGGYASRVSAPETPVSLGENVLQVRVEVTYELVK